MALDPTELDGHIARFEKHLKEVKDIRAAQRLETVKDILRKYDGEDKVIPFDEIVERLKKDPDEFKIMSGWPKLDEIIRGFRLKQLVVVSAYTKAGKTSAMMDLTTRIKAQNPLWLPFEESAEELLRKYLERGLDPPYGFTPSTMKGGALNWVESKIMEAIVKYDTQVVFIDHLDFLVPFNADNHALRVGEAMRTLKGLAKKWNVVIFLIAHMKKAKMDITPTLEDLRGSASIAQEADTVILIWREMKKERGLVTVTNNTIFSVQANRRHGSTGNVMMVYENGKFIEKEWREDILLEDEAESTYNSFGSS
jgi:replicative DNA helicase